MKWICLIMGSIILFMGVAYKPVIIDAASQTTINLEIPEPDNITEIDREPSKEATGDEITNDSQQSRKAFTYLPKTNAIFNIRMCLLGLLLVIVSVCLKAIVGKEKFREI